MCDVFSPLFNPLCVEFCGVAQSSLIASRFLARLLSRTYLSGKPTPHSAHCSRQVLYSCRTCHGSGNLWTRAFRRHQVVANRPSLPTLNWSFSLVINNMYVGVDEIICTCAWFDTVLCCAGVFLLTLLFLASDVSILCRSVWICPSFVQYTSFIL